MAAVLERDDAQAVRAARDGDAAAFGVLFDRWFDRAYDVALGVMRDPDNAAEVAQEAMLNAWQRLGTLEDPSRFGGWLLCSVRNRAIDRWHRERRQVPTDDAVLAALESQVLDAGTDAAGAAAVEATVEAAESRRLLWGAAAALSPEDVSLLDLQVRHDLTPAAIAGELGLNANAVHQRLFRLRKRMGESIGAYVLWNGGEPRCEGLRSELALAGVTRFDPAAAAVIRRHAGACSACGEDRRRRVSPEALLSAVPVATAPLWLRTRAAAAMEQAGGPSLAETCPGVEGAGTGGGTSRASGVRRWTRRVLVTSACALVLAAAALRAVRSPDPPAAAGGSSAAGQPASTSTASTAAPGTSEPEPPDGEPAVSEDAMEPAATEPPSSQPGTTSGLQSPAPSTTAAAAVQAPVPTTVPPAATPELPAIGGFAIVDYVLDGGCGPKLYAYTLNWSTKRASDVTITWPGGKKSYPESGTTTVCAMKGDVFTLYASNDVGTVSRTAP